jgi:hypothetical protein
MLPFEIRIHIAQPTCIRWVFNLGWNQPGLKTTCEDPGCCWRWLWSCAYLVVYTYYRLSRMVLFRVRLECACMYWKLVVIIDIYAMQIILTFFNSPRVKLERLWSDVAIKHSWYKRLVKTSCTIAMVTSTQHGACQHWSKEQSIQVIILCSITCSLAASWSEDVLSI